MARGQSLTSAFKARKRSGKWDDAAISQLVVDLERWSQTLQLGAMGFRLNRTASPAAIANGATTAIGWTAFEFNYEGWAVKPGGQDIMVPPAAGGLYWVQVWMNTTVAVGGAFFPILRKLPAGSATEVGIGNTRLVINDISCRVEAMTTLQPGDALRVYCQNSSGAAVTIGATAPGINNPQLPMVEAWRVALPPKSLNNS